MFRKFKQFAHSSRETAPFLRAGFCEVEDKGVAQDSAGENTVEVSRLDILNNEK
jgi:hypothetical protein